MAMSPAEIKKALAKAGYTQTSLAKSNQIPLVKLNTVVNKPNPSEYYRDVQIIIAKALKKDISDIWPIDDETAKSEKMTSVSTTAITTPLFDAKAIGRRLRNARKDFKLSEEEAANGALVSLSDVRGAETGRSLNFQYIIYISTTCVLSCDWILKGIEKNEITSKGTEENTRAMLIDFLAGKYPGSKCKIEFEING